jgi:hypothetical protein
MKKRFLALHPLIGTKNKPSTPNLLYRSPYYWWWEYLRRNADYLDCCNKGGTGELAALFANFGDIRSDNFREWWGAPQHRGEYLFAEQPIDFSVKKLDAEASSPLQVSSHVMLVAVNMELGRRFLQKRFATLLQKEHQGKRGRISLANTVSSARYPLHRNFSAHNLKEMLRTYDAVIANEALPKSQRLKLWQIGESLNLVPTAMPKKWDSVYETRHKHNTMTMTVSRHTKNARAIIRNTALGQFPNNTE